MCLLLSSLSFVFAVFIQSFALAAPQPLTLREALEQFNSSPELQIAKSKAEQAEWKRSEAFSQFLPTLKASALHLLDQKYMLIDIPNFPTPIPQIVPNTIYSLGIDWTIFDGFAGFDRYAAVRKREFAVKDESSWADFSGRREVILEFYKSLAAQSLKEVAEQNFKALEEHLKNVRLFRKA